MDSSSSGGVSDEEDNTRFLLSRRADYTRQLRESAYDLISYLERAGVHSELGYPDLSAGDAYRALLLVDEVLNEGFEYHEAAITALRERCGGVDEGHEWEIPAVLRKPDILERRIQSLALRNLQQNATTTTIPDDSDDEKTIQVARLASRRCYRILAISLLLCGCLKSAYEFCTRGLAITPEDEELLQAKEYIKQIAKRRLKVEEVDLNNLPDQGLVRREIYPWNDHEPDRYSQETLEFLNKELSIAAPKLEVKVVELPNLIDAVRDADGEWTRSKQLGLFAKEDIEPGEEILDELSLLAANNLLKESLCDACSTDLPPLTIDSKVVSCEDCDDIMFCNDDCLMRAQESYHPAICDTDIDTIAKDPDPKEKPFALYLLLLGRTFAMAATQEVHPLELKEVKYIWGDFLPTLSNAVPLSPNSEPPPIWTLPFSFNSNIASPLHILEKMDIDIFASIDQYDLWVFNTLYAKFRGTASGRLNKSTGHPEVAAVHPLWCLANHDCDPNVRWEWGARMRFWVREERIGGKKPGIRKGEEVLNHYTDPELPVKERREWAAGALGGMCMCDRCKREAGELDGNTQAAEAIVMNGHAEGEKMEEVLN